MVCFYIQSRFLYKINNCFILYSLLLSVFKLFYLNHLHLVIVDVTELRVNILLILSVFISVFSVFFISDYITWLSANNECKKKKSLLVFKVY